MGCVAASQAWNDKLYKKTMLSPDDLSGSIVDPRRMMNAATTNPTKHASAAHQ